MNEYEWRRGKGMLLKAYFNQMWSQTQTQNHGIISYHDMVNIIDMMRYKAPEILDGQILPKIIDAYLYTALSIFNTNKVSFIRDMKKAFHLAYGAGGVALLVMSLISILNVGILPASIAFIVGGTGSSIMAPLGVVGGGLVIILAFWRLTKKMTPQSRAEKCHEIVTKGIDKWVEKGSKKLDIKAITQQ